MKIAALLFLAASAATALLRWQSPTPPETPVAVATSAPTPEVPTVGRKIVDLADARINESSGLAASRRYQNCWWTHNDSGDEARLFLVNGAGQTLATVHLNGAFADDWEDMAIAGSGANAWVYVADIGDNLEGRADVTIYRFREPQIDTQSTLSPTLNVRCEKMTLRYPDGPHNAETLIANTLGDLLIVTKGAGPSGFFATLRPFRDGSKQTLKRVTTHQFGSIEPGNRSTRKRLTTGGDLSPDGKRLVVSTYAQAHEWMLPQGRFSTIHGQTPRTWDLPKLKQCEAIAYSADGKQLLVTSEGSPCPLWDVTPDS
jgi:hypothetical protein